MLFQGEPTWKPRVLEDSHLCELQSDGLGREHSAGALDDHLNLAYFVSIALAPAWSMNASSF